MKQTVALALLVATSLVSATACRRSKPLQTVPAPAKAADTVKGEPSLKEWQRILETYYDETKGMDYGALKNRDLDALLKVRNRLAAVDVDTLSKKQQLAYWINVYNVNVVSVVAQNYPIGSIKELSTDLVKRLNVFEKPVVPVGKETISLNEVENSKIREGFSDPRIHFAINCAAETCPPLRPEPYTGEKIDQQLDEQARKFLEGPHGVKVSGGTVTTTPIMKWFADDFKEGGGQLAFIRKHVGPEKLKVIDAAGKTPTLDFDSYSWKLNDKAKQ